MALPEKYKRLSQVEHIGNIKHGKLNECFKVEEVPMPVLKYNEVLVKVDAAPINPSDVFFMKGVYGEEPPSLPHPVGLEGCGVVVATGGGYFTWGKTGKRVAFVISSGGSYGEYVVVNAKTCITLGDDVTPEVGASSIVNPLTCISMFDIIKTKKLKYVVHTAAASALGRMMIRMGISRGVSVVCVVRRKEQVDICKSEGALHVFNTSDDTFKEEFTTFVRTHGVKFGFDAVGGELTGTILNAMPGGSTVLVYGALSSEPCSNINPSDLIFKNKTLGGYWLTKDIETKSMMTMLGWISTVQKQIKSNLITKVRGTCDLDVDKFCKSLKDYADTMSDGKMLVMPTH
eukprot:GHVR01129616.1.p1 GENE.GHVR01129616.1~~GHVR01129616.1.p1  ORF type:complete len:345 (-),score=87.58 GHVR01129616.1:288-1322(-)